PRIANHPWLQIQRNHMPSCQSSRVFQQPAKVESGTSQTLSEGPLMSVVRLTVDRVAFRAGCGTFRLIATSASTAALEGEADMAGNGPKTTFMTLYRLHRPGSCCTAQSPASSQVIHASFIHWRMVTISRQDEYRPSWR